MRGRLKRVFDIEIEVCDYCAGSVKVIACIEDKAVIEPILGHLKRKGDLPELARISHHPSRQLLLHCSTSGTPDRCIHAVVLRRHYAASCLTFTRSERST